MTTTKKDLTLSPEDRKQLERVGYCKLEHLKTYTTVDEFVVNVYQALTIVGFDYRRIYKAIAKRGCLVLETEWSRYLLTTQDVIEDKILRTLYHLR